MVFNNISFYFRDHCKKELIVLILKLDAALKGFKQALIFNIGNNSLACDLN